MYISKLQYITPQYKDESFFDTLQQVIDADIDWVQIRVKDIPRNQWLSIARKAVIMCQEAGVTCIINDDPLIAKESSADGVHLGKNDMTPKEARNLLGKSAIIGGTANTIDDIEQLYLQDVNYIGLGPFQFTTTKENLSPILGIEGYTDIIKQCNERCIRIPIISIGGITIEDIPGIMHTGIHGIAISSFITRASNIPKTVGEIKKQLKM